MRTHGADTCVHAELVAYRPVNYDHRRGRAGCAAACTGPVAASARITGKYSGLAPAITALTADRILPVLSENCGTHMPNHFVRLVTGMGQHRRHTFLGGQDDRQLVGPEVLMEESVQVSSLSGSTSRGVERSNKTSFSSSAPNGESLDYLLHYGTAGDRVVAVDVGA